MLMSSSYTSVAYYSDARCRRTVTSTVRFDVGLEEREY